MCFKSQPVFLNRSCVLQQLWNCASLCVRRELNQCTSSWQSLLEKDRRMNVSAKTLLCELRKHADLERRLASQLDFSRNLSRVLWPKKIGIITKQFQIHQSKLCRAHKQTWRHVLKDCTWTNISIEQRSTNVDLNTFCIRTTQFYTQILRTSSLLSLRGLESEANLIDPLVCLLLRGELPPCGVKKVADAAEPGIARHGVTVTVTEQNHKKTKFISC